METYFDFKHNIEYANKQVNDKIDLHWVYFQQFAKKASNVESDCQNLKLEINQLNDKLDDLLKYEKWKSSKSIFKILWWKLIRKDIYKIYKSKNKDGNVSD